MDTQVTLPDKLYELLEVAINDLIEAEMDPKYEIHMGEWHRYEEDEDVCYVCLAGSYMAMSLEEPYKDRLDPFFIYSTSVANKLAALDYIRFGAIWQALDVFYDNEYRIPRVEYPNIPETMVVSSYACNPDAWMEEYRSYS